MRVEKTVFISYRRTNVYTAIAIYQKEFNWQPELIEEARKLIAKL